MTKATGPVDVINWASEIASEIDTLQAAAVVSAVQAAVMHSHLWDGVRDAFKRIP